MNLTTFCDLHSVSGRTRSAAVKLFGDQELPEGTWSTKFTAKGLVFSRKTATAATPTSALQELLKKNLDELIEMAQGHPEEEWEALKSNKAKLAKYLTTKI